MMKERLITFIDKSGDSALGLNFFGAGVIDILFGVFWVYLYEICDK